MALVSSPALGYVNDLNGISTALIHNATTQNFTATISLGNQQITAPPRIPDHAQAILNDLAQGGD